MRYVGNISAAGDGTDFPVRFGGDCRAARWHRRTIYRRADRCRAPRRCRSDTVMEEVLLAGRLAAPPQGSSARRADTAIGQRPSRRRPATRLPPKSRHAPQPSPRRFSDGKRPSEAVIRQLRPTRASALAGDTLVGEPVVALTPSSRRASAARRSDLDTIESQRSSAHQRQFVDPQMSPSAGRHARLPKGAYLSTAQAYSEALVGNRCPARSYYVKNRQEHKGFQLMAPGQLARRCSCNSISSRRPQWLP